MTLQDFINKSKRQYDRHGTSALPPIAGDFIASTLSKIPRLGRVGRNVYNHEWDVLLILDATRVDMYRDVVREPTETPWMSGASSPEFMANNYTEKYTEEMKETAFVTGNPFSKDHARGKFGVLDEAWSHSWDENLGTMPPGPITDRTIQYHREGWDRVIGHFMQPHYPFVGRETTGGKMDWEVTGDGAETDDDKLALWDQFLFGERDDLEDVKRAYWENLRYVWDYVETIMENVDGKIIVTSDHGNAMGEWGLWGHKPGFLHPQMRRVPWDVYYTSDKQTHYPEINDLETTEDVNERLSQLGYK